jgi:hypothetical protein
MAQLEKQTAHEPSRPKKRKFHFRPEGYVHPDDIEFLEQFVEFLQEERLAGRFGFTPDELIYSGIDASKILAAGVKQKAEAVFAMNEVCWKRNAEKPHGKTTPGGYAKDATRPAILLYERNQLAHASEYKLRLDPEDPTQIVEIYDIVPGQLLINEQIDEDVEEVVIHKDYPHKSPTDALVGIVYLED